MSAGIVLVQQYQKLVVQKFGTYIGTQGSGLRFLIPLMYHGTKVDLRERVTRVPTQKYIPADNVVVDMDFVTVGDTATLMWNGSHWYALASHAAAADTGVVEVTSTD